MHNNQRCDTLNDLNLGWQRCDSRTVFPSCRVVSTVTTTARWEGRRSPTWPYPPATACSKSLVASHTCCMDNICRDIHRTESVSTVFSPLCTSLSPGSGMFDDGVHTYLIEPLRQTHSAVSYSTKTSTPSALKSWLIMCFSITCQPSFSVNQLEYFSRKQLQGLIE